MGRFIHLWVMEACWGIVLFSRGILERKLFVYFEGLEVEDFGLS